jgi:hypothetical protein
MVYVRYYVFWTRRREMPDTKPHDTHKPPLPKVLTVNEFHERFGADEDCMTHLKTL